MPLLAALLALPACRGRRPPGLDLDGTFVTVPPVSRKLAGVSRGGRFVDPERGWSVEIPEDWTAEPGWSDEDLRVRLTHVLTQVTLEIAAYPEAEITPRERDSCLWTFRDTGHYSALPVPGEVTVAGCTPWEPTGPRVQGWYTVAGPWAYHLELVLPDGYLVAGLQAGEDLIRTFELGEI